MVESELPKPEVNGVVMHRSSQQANAYGLELWFRRVPVHQISIGMPRPDPLARLTLEAGVEPGNDTGSKA